MYLLSSLRFFAVGLCVELFCRSLTVAALESFRSSEPIGRVLVIASRVTVTSCLQMRRTHANAYVVLRNTF